MDKEAFKELGTYLREKRLELGLTQVDVAKVLGYRPQFIANWERGASSPPAHALRKLVDIYELTEREFLMVLDRIQNSYWRRAIFNKKPRRRA